MQTVALGTPGRSTTRLGFGCSSVMESLNRRDSLRMLESAFEAGIRHKNPRHIAANALLADDPALDHAAQRLYSLVQDSLIQAEGASAPAAAPVTTASGPDPSREKAV